jgi:predicted small metal-binding protein
MSEHQLIVECPCGVVIRAASEASLVASVQSHASEVHDMRLDEQQILDMARPS